jgi:drug/metabolite transporter (DMT)-like permease
MKTYAVLALAIIAQATGNVCLSKGMKELSSASSVWVLFSQAVESPTIWIGTALLLFFFLLFVTALSWADLSFVVPAISVEVIVNVAFADFFLKEPVSSVRWLGTVLVSIGVIFVLRTGKQGVRSDSESAGRR